MSTAKKLRVVYDAEIELKKGVGVAKCPYCGHKNVRRTHRKIVDCDGCGVQFTIEGPAAPVDHARRKASIIMKRVSERASEVAELVIFERDDEWTTKLIAAAMVFAETSENYLEERMREDER